MVAVVIRMGRRRLPAASRMAACLSSPSLRRWLMASMRTMALFTTMPASITMPIMATMLMLVPVRNRATMTPMAPSGNVKMMTNGCRNDSNCEAITR